MEFILNECGLVGDDPGFAKPCLGPSWWGMLVFVCCTCVSVCVRACVRVFSMVSVHKSKFDNCSEKLDRNPHPVLFVPFLFMC